MQDWKDLLNKLADGFKSEPILAFVALIIIVLALVGAQLSPEFRGLVIIVVLLVVMAYVARLLGWGKPKAEPDRKTSPSETPPPSSAKFQPPTSAYETRSAYLTSLIADCRPARLVGLDPQAADPSRGVISLERLYVSLDTLTPLPEEEQRSRSRAKRGAEAERQFLPEREKGTWSAIEALAHAPDRHAVLLGLPGSGKSTLVRYLALRMAQVLSDPSQNLNDLLPGWEGSPVLPVIVPLGRLAESLPPDSKTGRAEMIEQYLQAVLQADEHASAFAPQLLAALQHEGGLILFDGLDEVADLNLRPVVVQAVERFVDRYGRHPATRCLVTCRKFSYTDRRWQLIGWPTHELAPLSPEKIGQFVTAWHVEHARIDPARKEDYDRKCDRLLTALQPGDRRRLSEIAPNPLILTLMAVVHTHRGELPDTRAQVYEECVDLLLVRWELVRTVLGKSKKSSLLDALDVPRITLESALLEIAYRAHESRAERSGDGSSAALVTEDLLRGVLHAYLKDDAKVQTFLDYCESANGLLMLQGVAPLPDAPPDSPPRLVYAFPHLTFEEYLAARYIRKLRNVGREVRQHLDRSSDRWREVAMLLGEHVCFKEGDTEVMDNVLNALIPGPPPDAPIAQDWRAAWLAGDLLTLVRRISKGQPPAYARAQHSLRALLETGALTPPERAAAGNTLSDLGDPRFHGPDRFCLPAEPLLGFVEIPSGPFLMGSDPTKDKYAKEWADEQPQHRVELPTYYMARYPVTVDEFRAFVNDSGYPPSDADSLRGAATHPVVNVTWYDALKYCEWLTGKLRVLAPQHDRSPFWQGLREGKLHVTLPSEAEWEKAARGSDGRLYPWGNAFDRDKANVAMNIGRTSAVGCFPNGRSPYEILDMSGNVWEWTRSLWGKDWQKPEFKYPYDPKDKRREDLNASGGVLRVWRGGSWG